MIRDENVFIMGEEVGRYNGAYKVSIAICSGSGGEPVGSYVGSSRPSATFRQGSARRLHTYRCRALEISR